MKTFTDGEWVYVECDAGDLAEVLVQVGNTGWSDAYRGWYEGYRVAQIRVPAGAKGVQTILISVDGTTTRADNLRMSG